MAKMAVRPNAEFTPRSHVPPIHGEGYRPQITWNGYVLWEADEIVPFHHGDYDSGQVKKAELIAEEHIVDSLRKLFL